MRTSKRALVIGGAVAAAPDPAKAAADLVESVTAALRTT